MKTILFPTDLFDQSSTTLSYLHLMARVWQARVILLHVYQPVIADTSLPTFADPGMGSLATLDLETISQKHLNTLVEKFRSEGLDVVGEWRVGDVEDSIIDAAREFSPDILITQRSAVATFFDRLVGSAADDVARQAPCPVLFIPDDETEAGRPSVAFRSVAYVLQPTITQSMVTEQTSAIIDAFDAHLTVITPEQIEENKPDLFIIQRRETGFLGGLMGTDPTEKLLSSSQVPVLVYHAAE
ncbi:universal stress protein [Fibrella forsythiae]|uniref:Universal stress protein n=1 Tax=Fibrella forsythiae TaxID=2817061 RepID=A0ABS3JF39_9BACT|nr:universal stress protein [Fibrella forsythiae]MBO0948061.1 universal stress protein [Fibrella forsythiae]